jgi:hypothetical protein
MLEDFFMRASIKLSSVFTSLLLAGTLVSAATKAPVQAAKPAAKPVAAPVKQDENALASAIVQKLLSSIKGPVCGFQLELDGWLDLTEGAKNDSKSPLKYLDVDCTVPLSDKEDISFSLLQSEEEKKANDGFDTVLNLKSKGMTLQLYGQKINGNSVLSVRFFSGVDKTNAFIPKPLEVTVSLTNGDKVLSSEIIALRFSAIDIKVQENPKNPAELLATASCKSEKKELSRTTFRNEFVPAICLFEGSYEPKKALRYNFKFKNANKQTVLP